jgi:hypothetical protein
LLYSPLRTRPLPPPPSRCAFASVDIRALRNEAHTLHQPSELTYSVRFFRSRFIQPYVTNNEASVNKYAKRLSEYKTGQSPVMAYPERTWSFQPGLSWLGDVEFESTGLAFRLACHHKQLRTLVRRRYTLRRPRPSRNTAGPRMTRSSLPGQCEVGSLFRSVTVILIPFFQTAEGADLNRQLVRSASRSTTIPRFEVLRVKGSGRENGCTAHGLPEPTHQHPHTIPPIPESARAQAAVMPPMPGALVATLTIKVWFYVLSGNIGS